MATESGFPDSLKDTLSLQSRAPRPWKDPQLALDKREATMDVQVAIIQFMMHEAPKGSSQKVTFGEGWYEIIVKPCKRPTSKELKKDS